MDFEVVGPIRAVETIAAGQGIRILERLIREFGHGNWLKRKGVATIRLQAANSSMPRFTGMRHTASGSVR